MAWLLGPWPMAWSSATAILGHGCAPEGMLMRLLEGHRCGRSRGCGETVGGGMGQAPGLSHALEALETMQGRPGASGLQAGRLSMEFAWGIPGQGAMDSPCRRRMGCACNRVCSCAIFWGHATPRHVFESLACAHGGFQRWRCRISMRLAQFFDGWPGPLWSVGGLVRRGFHWGHRRRGSSVRQRWRRNLRWCGVTETSPSPVAGGLGT
jgi:hypothetical protein